MSYEATYSSKVNTRLVRQSSTNICAGVISIVSSIRETAQERIRVMDEFMNQNVEFPCSIVELKTELRNSITRTVRENPNLSISQCYMKAITNHAVMKKIVKNVSSYKVYEKSPNLTGRKAFKITEQLINECATELEKTFVDVKTVLTVQAITTCGWQIVDTKAEKTSQTIIAQNNEGTVLAVQIQPEKMSMDVTGLCDSSCQTHVKKIIDELEKLGIETKVDNENEHRRKGGGTLLTFCSSAASINKVTRLKESLRQSKNLSFQTNDRLKTTSSHNIREEEKKKERV